MAKSDAVLVSMIARMADMYGLLMTPANVRDLLKCGRATSYEWLRDLPAVSVGKRRLYRIEDVAEKVLASRERKGVLV